uniref:Putative treble-clef zinc-finger domain-containing protein n=1 Tax=Esox lucius TaxID=8010 RepID=A0A6Q2YNX0_ESOLU
MKNATTPSFLSNLGKPTLRGIRKCPQCGVYNGTRGLSCKNKACGVVFRDGGAAAGESSAGGAQVFSVCQRGRGASAQQGFVELVPTDTAVATSDGTTLLTRVSVGRCFLPTCRHAQGQRSGPGHTPCVHVKLAMECQAQATPLPLKSSILEGLQASAEAREELWRLATESPGPLVQRVNKDTLVVKCHSGPNHPLGLLHLTVGARGSGAWGRTEGRSRDGAVYQCACQEAVRGSSGVSPDSTSLVGAGPCVCLHFYACVCAFASHEKLATEFSAFLNYCSNGRSIGVCRMCVCVRACVCVTILSFLSVPSLCLHCLAFNFPFSSPTLPSVSTLPRSSQPVEESQVTLGFRQWLASVTERIHQTMHYQFDGKPEPLVFHVPQVFFNSLQHRLSLGSKKRRLPNATSAFVRNDDLPHGTFSKYTWHITNLMQVKRIFDTPELPLELTQSFVKNSDGSYSPFRCPQPLPPDPSEGFSRTDRPQAIRPLELRTFLNVGQHTVDQKDPTPFVIEWIPDILPRCHVGELRLSFQYGHQLGGQS